MPEEGPAFSVQEVNGLKVGLLNCYEAEVPELTRRLAVLGADLVVIPTAADAWARLSDGRRTDRPYPDVSRTLLVADCVPSDYGDTHPMGTRYLEDLQPDLYR